MQPEPDKRNYSSPINKLLHTLRVIDKYWSILSINAKREIFDKK